jgi:hypothetical protein
MAARTYTADIAGGTATVTIQAQTRQTLKRALVSWVPTAAAKLELSTNATSQIGTAQPTTDVVFRLTGSGTAAGANITDIVISLPVVPFQSIYVHTTGAGLGSITLS